MEDQKSREPRLIAVESEVLLRGDDNGTELNTGNYIAHLANTWAAVRRKQIEQQ
jgi:hypothetical protein